MEIIDLKGQKFGKLLVLNLEINYINATKKCAYWRCLCDCGNEIVVQSYSLRSGNTKSCGCLNKELLVSSKRYTNSYDLSNEFGIGYTRKKQIFYFDKEDYEKIRRYSWFINHYGYVSSNTDFDRIGRTIFLHNLVLDNIPSETGLEIDHVDHRRINNQKNNLRIVDRIHNMQNGSLRKDNKSGYIGVAIDNINNKWLAQITVNQEHKNLGRYVFLDDAVRARLSAEKEYFGEFAPQKYLFEQYGI